MYTFVYSTGVIVWVWQKITSASSWGPIISCGNISKRFCNNKKNCDPSFQNIHKCSWIWNNARFFFWTDSETYMYTYMYIAVYIGLTSREYDDVMRQIWATCDACFQYQMWKRSNYTLYSLKEFLTWRFFMSPLLSHHDMRLVCMCICCCLTI